MNAKENIESRTKGSGEDAATVDLKGARKEGLSPAAILRAKITIIP